MNSPRRLPCSPAAAATQLDVDDLLSEILLRLPPLPSSLPRASAVCKRWRLLVTGARFLRRFRIRHRGNPPLLGCFVNKHHSLTFVPTMEAPNRVPPERFSFQWDRASRFQFLGCRHGLVLFSDLAQHQFVVWDPVNGDQHRVAIPPGFDLKTTDVNGEVLRAAGGGVHFQVVFVTLDSVGTQHGKRAFVCVYSSETGIWGNLVSTPVPSEPEGGNNIGLILFGTRVSMVPAVLVGDSLYWSFTGASSILEFDFEKQSLAWIRVPVAGFKVNSTVTRADGGGLGFLFMSANTVHLWKRETGCDGVAAWVLARTIELDKLFSQKSENMKCIMILGFAEENNVVLLRTSIGFYAVQLQSLQFKKLPEFNIGSDYHPFETVYTADIGGELDGGQFLHTA